MYVPTTLYNAVCIARGEEVRRSRSEEEVGGVVEHGAASGLPARRTQGSWRGPYPPYVIPPYATTTVWASAARGQASRMAATRPPSSARPTAALESLGILWLMLPLCQGRGPKVVADLAGDTAVSLNCALRPAPLPQTIDCGVDTAKPDARAALEPKRCRQSALTATRPG